MSRKGDHTIEAWVDQKLMRGKNAFSLDELRKDYPTTRNHPHHADDAMIGKMKKDC